MDKIETRTAFIFVYEKNIVWEDFKLDVEIEVDDIKENISASLKLAGNKPHSAILDTRDRNVSISNEAMMFGASPVVTKNRFATAHLTSSLAGRLIGNFFMKFYKPKIHNRMFSDEKEAIDWLRSFSA